MQVRMWRTAEGKFDILMKPSRRSGLAAVLTRGVSLEDIEGTVLPSADLEEAAHRALKELKRANKRP